MSLRFRPDRINFILHLPEDVSTHIFLKLPLKSFVTCACVCKSWRSFIKSPVLFSSHLTSVVASHQENDDHLCLLQLCTLPLKRGKDSFFFLSAKDRDFNEQNRIRFPNATSCGLQVLASCNGLVLLLHGRYNAFVDAKGLCLWNPFVRKSMIIYEGRDLNLLEAVGLGFDSTTGDFKAPTIIEDRDNRSRSTLMVNLYSVKANSWKRLPDVEAEHERMMTLQRGMTYLNGSLYFVASRRMQKKTPMFLILGFDLSEEVFHEVMLPDRMIKEFSISPYCASRFHLLTCGESLAVLWFKDTNNIEMELWVMREYGVQESWTQLSTIRPQGLECPIFLDITGLVVTKHAHVLLGVASFDNGDGMVFSHDLKSQETKEIINDEKQACFFLGDYVESLALIDKGNDLERHFKIESDNGVDDTSSYYYPGKEVCAMCSSSYVPRSGTATKF